MGCRIRDSCKKLFPNLELLPLPSEYTLSLLLFIIRNKNQIQVNYEKHEINTKQRAMSKLWWSLDNFKGKCSVPESNVAAASIPHTSQHSRRWRSVIRWAPDMPSDTRILKCFTYHNINICSWTGIMSLAEVVCF